MEIEIESKKNNPLIDRTEIHFTISHEGKRTPDREIIRSELAEKLNVKKDNVIINNINSGFGIQVSKGYAKVYKSVEKSKNLERKHILQRNKLIEKKGKKKEEKPTEIPAKPPKEEPAEKTGKPVAEPLKEAEQPVEEPPKEEKPTTDEPPAEEPTKEKAPSEEPEQQEKVEEPKEEAKSDEKKKE